MMLFIGGCQFKSLLGCGQYCVGAAYSVMEKIEDIEIFRYLNLLIIPFSSFCWNLGRVEKMRQRVETTTNIQETTATTWQTGNYYQKKS